MDNPILDLSSLGLLHIYGDDAKTFLQGQVTCDMNEVIRGQSRLGAHCSLKGRVHFIFRAFTPHESNPQEYFLAMPDAMIPHAQACLKKYAIFSKVNIERADVRTINLQEIFPDRSITWELFEIQAGIPTIYPQNIDQLLPHHLNLDLLGAISFNKGCYVGQEIVARMHYRGQIKKRLHRARVSDLSQPIQPGDKIVTPEDTDEPAGTVVRAAAIPGGYELLAVINEKQLKGELQLFNCTGSTLQLVGA